MAISEFSPPLREPARLELNLPPEISDHHFQNIRDNIQRFDIGSPEVQDTKYSKSFVHPSGWRAHEQVRVQISGYEHRMWVTQPVPEVTIEDDITVVAKPGLSEIIEKGIGYKFHTTLADSLPGATVISHATAGVGPSAERKSVWELSSHGIDEMAAQGLELLKAFCEKQRIVWVGTSMGTVIGHKLLQLNSVEGKPVDVVGAVMYAPAIVDPQNVPADMAFGFLPTLARDVGVGFARDICRELLSPKKPRQIVRSIKNLMDSSPSLRDIPPIIHQMIDLLEGTPDEEVEANLDNYKIAVITGTEDSVGQTKAWQRRQRNHPEMLLELIAGRGHDIAIQPVPGAKKVAKTIKIMGLYPEDDQSALLIT